MVCRVVSITPGMFNIVYISGVESCDCSIEFINIHIPMRAHALTHKHTHHTHITLSIQYLEARRTNLCSNQWEWRSGHENFSIS